VVIGDSFTAGKGASTLDPDSTFAADQPLDFAHRLGYAQRFRDEAEAAGVRWSVYHNLSVSGETSAEIMNGSPRLGFPDSQLNDALQVIKADPGRGLAILVQAGGNDLLQFMAGNDATFTPLPCFAPDLSTNPQTLAACLTNIDGVLDRFEANLDAIVSTVKTSAGRKPHIVALGTYANFFLYQPCTTGAPAGIGVLGSWALEGDSPIPQILSGGLNDRIRAVGAKHGAKVIDIYADFAANAAAFNAGTAAPWVNFLNPRGQADCNHPNDAGYGVILGKVKALRL
jgi:lysophospholipase L1-like esterase